MLLTNKLFILFYYIKKIPLSGTQRVSKNAVFETAAIYSRDSKSCFANIQFERTPAVWDRAELKSSFPVTVPD